MKTLFLKIICLRHFLLSMFIPTASLNNGSYLFRVTSAEIPTNYYISPPGYCSFEIVLSCSPWTNETSVIFMLTVKFFLISIYLETKCETISDETFIHNMSFLWEVLLFVATEEDKWKYLRSKSLTRWLIGTSSRAHGLLWRLAHNILHPHCLRV